ncbi:MAG: hypothetical protein ACRELD_16020 [Longimicrobiales bacterium]
MRRIVAVLLLAFGGTLQASPICPIVGAAPGASVADSHEPGHGAPTHHGAEPGASHHGEHDARGCGSVMSCGFAAVPAPALAPAQVVPHPVNRELTIAEVHASVVPSADPPPPRLLS